MMVQVSSNPIDPIFAGVRSAFEPRRNRRQKNKATRKTSRAMKAHRPRSAKKIASTDGARFDA